MISFLEGTIESNNQKEVIVAVNGVGYKIHLSGQAIKNLPKVGEKIKLFTYLHVRENILDLYGFLDSKEREIFELLITVSGIGPKGALNILTVASVETLKRAIAKEESEILTKVSGIGKKMAEKIILELKNKVEDSLDGESLSAEAESIEALISLGYKIAEARETLRKVPIEITDVAQRVTEALKLLGKK